MSAEANPVTLQILDKEYRIACPIGEEENLHAAAKLLTVRMRDILESGNVIPPERVAVMAALNISHELLQSASGDGKTINAVEQRLRGLQNRLQEKLIEFKQIEI